MTRYEKSGEDSSIVSEQTTDDDIKVTLCIYGKGLLSEVCDSETIYHLYDHLGSTTKLTDADGKVIAGNTYGS